jgi:succinate dehydrogenase / fumarate reductase flavoprotein subunit
VGKLIHNQRLGVYLDFSRAIETMGVEKITEKYGNLFEMYERITDENPLKTPMKIYPAPHYSMGGLWVDYNLMTTREGLFAIGEANFSDHGANRLGASSLMQGLADGYFILPRTVADYLARSTLVEITEEHPQVRSALASAQNNIDRLMKAPEAKHSPEYFHQQLGKILWDSCGMLREKSKLKQSIEAIERLKNEFWQKIKITGVAQDFNQTLERAARVIDFIELGQLMCMDALNREESCGTHARVEHLFLNGEAKRNDENFSYCAAWEFQKEGAKLHKEPLHFDFIKPSVRNYK